MTKQTLLWCFLDGSALGELNERGVISRNSGVRLRQRPLGN
jgi:hypothetical protein